MLADNLDAAYRAVSNRLADNNAVRIETADGHDRPVLTALDKLDEPPSLVTLRTAVDDLLPRVDLPDVLLEVAGWTGFLTEFTHVSDGAARAEDLDVGICAVLVAEACNIGLEPVVQASNPALSRSRLSWVDQNYIPDGLLEQQASLQPHELMTDTAATPTRSSACSGCSATNSAHASPTSAPPGSGASTATPTTARSTAWPATTSTPTSSPRTGTACCASPAASPPAPCAPPNGLLRVLQGGGRPTPLGRAVAELGRITKTLYLLAYLDDETYRRRILTHLNRTESRHSLARAVFHGQRGQRYREGQEDPTRRPRTRPQRHRGTPATKTPP